MGNENKSSAEISSYDFGIIDLIKEGWARMNGVKTQFIIAFILYVIIAVIVSILLAIVFPQGTEENPNLLNQLIASVISIPVLVPLFVGMYMMAINHVRGEAIEFKLMFNYYPMTGVLSLASISVYIMMFIGFILLVLPGIYLSIAYIFTLPLIADKGMGVWEAMEYSRKKVTEHWFKIFGLTLLLGLIVMVGTMLLGIGLIWAMPLMFVTLYGLLYTRIFDEGEA